MKTNQPILKDVLARDPIAEFEEMTGLDYKSFRPNSLEAKALMGHFLRTNADKETMLKLADDSGFSNTVVNYMRIITEIGFKEVLKLPFLGHGWGDAKTVQETLYIFWHPEKGILLEFDTFGTDKVNSGNFYYNIEPLSQDKEDRRAVPVSSGSWHQREDGTKFHYGHTDCREGIRFHIEQLTLNGKFMPVWEKRPFLWLLHYMDTKDENGKSLEHTKYDYNKINAERVAMLPEEVQVAIHGDGQD